MESRPGDYKPTQVSTVGSAQGGTADWTVEGNLEEAATTMPEVQLRGVATAIKRVLEERLEQLEEAEARKT